MIPCGWGEWCGGVVGLRTLIIGDINKAMKKRIQVTGKFGKYCILAPSFGDVIISP